MFSEITQINRFIAFYSKNEKIESRPHTSFFGLNLDFLLKVGANNEIKQYTSFYAATKI